MLVDEDDNEVEDKETMESIYADLDKVITKTGKTKGQTFEIKLVWIRLKLSPIQSKFMGELFIKSAYSDKVLHEATKSAIDEIENKLPVNRKIIFYMTKLLEDSDIDLAII
jgi:hypothetical protein